MAWATGHRGFKTSVLPISLIFFYVMESIKKEFADCGQAHVFDHVGGLSEVQVSALFDQAKQIEHPQRLNDIFEASVCGSSQNGDSSLPNAVIEPLDKDVVVTQASITSEQRQAWRRVGLDMISRGALGILLLAGGQGTRLGSSKPKGCYDVGLPSGKSLFQIQAERIRRLQVLAAESTSSSTLSEPLIRWYIMTSPATHKDTVGFFESHDYFGLQQEQIKFFSQGMLPAFTEDGKIIMEAKDRIAMAPDGNGGVYVALKKHEIFEDMEKHGVEALDCCSVDNILVRLGDPIFAGYCKSSGIECGARVVAKSYPEEKVGVFAQRGGKLQVVEYSELDPIEACAEDPTTGVLKYNWSNICLHYFEREWLKKVSTALSQGGSYHVAKKNIPTIGETKIPGIKLELFIFDTFSMADQWGLMEVKREEEFSPVKNAPGSANDSPDTARQHVLSLHASWIAAQGGMFEDAEQTAVEVSPLVSYAGENLEWTKGRTFRSKEYIRDVKNGE